MTTRRLQRAVSAVATAVGRPSLLASARIPSFWAAVPAAAAEAPQVAAQSSDNFAFVGSFGMPTAAIIAAATGLFYTIHRMGELTEKVAASEKTIATITAATETKIAANKEAAASAIAATEAKLAANEKATEAKLVANEKASEAKLAAAEKVIAAMMAGVSVTAELATLKALKGEPKRETPKDEVMEH